MFASPADGRLRRGASLPAMPPAAIAIRPPQPADARAIAGLLGELGYPTTPEQWARRLERLDREPATWLFVAEVAGDVAGLAALRVLTLVERDEPVGRLIALVVGERFRRAGVGRALVARVETQARRARCTQLDLTSGDRRDGAHAFYRRLGFADVSRRFVKDLDP
jgi:GNAT superfamily N-acetyltransferase